MSALPVDWGVPELTDTNRAWFTSETLAVQHCVACDVLQHPPEELCHVCGSMELSTRVLAPRGTVASYTVVHYPAHRRLADAVPYTAVLVSLDEAPHIRVLGNIECAPAEVHIGMPVEAYWEEREAGGEVVLLPQWRPSRGTQDR